MPAYFRALAFDAIFWIPFGLLPILATPWVSRFAAAFDLYIMLTYTILLGALADLSGPARRYFYLATGLLLWLGSAVVLAYRIFANGRIDAFGLLDAGLSAAPRLETLSYVPNVALLLPWLVVLSLPFVALYLRWNHLGHPAHPRFAAALMALFLVPLGFRIETCRIARCRTVSGALAGQLRRYAPASAYLAVNDMFTLRSAMAMEQARQAPRVTQKGDAPLTLLVIVDETINRNHMSLYGYCRPTTPRLEARARELFVFRDLASLMPLTHFAVPEALQAWRLKGGRSGSLFKILNAGGYSTYWISDQSVGAVSGNRIVGLASDARSQTWLNRQLETNAYAVFDPLDTALLAPLARAMAGSQPRKAIVLHLNGAHFSYSQRYPAGYLREGFAPLSGWRTQRQRDQIDEYDRAIHYDDGVLDQFLAKLAAAGGDSVAVIFSDHGEEVFDRMPWQGHIYPDSTEDMMEPPLLVWLSPPLRAHRPDLVRTLVAATSMPLRMGDITPLIVDLAGLSVDGLEPSMRPLSGDFRQLPRMSDGRDYDADRTLGIKQRLPPLCGPRPGP